MEMFIIGCDKEEFTKSAVDICLTIGFTATDRRERNFDFFCIILAVWKTNHTAVNQGLNLNSRVVQNFCAACVRSFFEKHIKI